MSTVRDASSAGPVPPSQSDQTDAILAVIRRAGSWTILSWAGARGRFDHRVDAEEAALRLRARSGVQGLDVTVLVQSAAGELERL